MEEAQTVDVTDGSCSIGWNLLFCFRFLFLSISYRGFLNRDGYFAADFYRS